MKVLAICSFFLASGPLLAGSLTIVNPSFEAQPLSLGASIGGTLTGWTVIGGDQGPFHPTSSQYSTPVPDGFNVAYSNGGDITQTLSDVLTASISYTLSVWIGDRFDTGLPSYTISLLAGSNVLVSATNPVSPAPGTFGLAQLSYTATGASPGLGQALTIDLHSTTVQVNYDEVNLDATPEPGTASMAFLVLLVPLFQLPKLLRKRKLAPQRL